MQLNVITKKMKYKSYVERIKDEVASKKIAEHFRVSDFDFLKKSPSFLSKHREGNGRYSEYFIRVKRGLYKLK